MKLFARCWPWNGTRIYNSYSWPGMRAAYLLVVLPDALGVLLTPVLPAVLLQAPFPLPSHHDCRNCCTQEGHWQKMVGQRMALEEKERKNETCSFSLGFFYFFFKWLLLVGWFVYKQNPILIPLKITYLKLVLVNEARGLESHRLSLHLAHSPQSSLQGTSREHQEHLQGAPGHWGRQFGHHWTEIPS